MSWSDRGFLSAAMALGCCNVVRRDRSCEPCWLDMSAVIMAIQPFLS